MPLRLEIVTIERKVYDDQVDMVIAPGTEGVMGILPLHAPLLTALTYGELQIKKQGQEDQFYAIGGGFMEIQPGHVIVLADSAEHADEIDMLRAEAARQSAQELLAGAKDQQEFEKAEIALRRSATRLKISERRRRAGRGSGRPPTTSGE